MAAPAGAVPKRHTTSLKREIGLSASLGLDGLDHRLRLALRGPEGPVAAGPAAIISWVIGGVAILVLALVHAELGGMYPVSGGSARFPHYAFGGAAGASFGWFSWLQAATVAPIEVLGDDHLRASTTTSRTAGSSPRTACSPRAA